LNSVVLMDSRQASSLSINSMPSCGEFCVFPTRQWFHKLLKATLLLLTLLLASCVKETDSVSLPLDPGPDTLATDSFVMRNPEIREDLLKQLDIHRIEYWVNVDGSIGFFVRDTSEVDRLANEAIGVYISLQ